MSRFFRKSILVFLVISLFSVEGNGQILDNAIINLNPGGVIYDIADVPHHDCYVIVGNFSSINGYPVSNIAFLNKADLSVNTNDTLNSINSINGEIRAVELYMSESFSYYTFRLYLGGNFTNIQTNGDATVVRSGFVELLSQKSKLLPMTETAFSITSWNLQMDDIGFGRGVNDIYRSNDTLIIVGGFSFLAGPAYDNLVNVVSFNAQTHIWLGGLFGTGDGYASLGYDDAGHVLSIEKSGNYYYISGSDQFTSGGYGYIYRYDLNGTLDLSFMPDLCGTQGEVWKTVSVKSGTETIFVSTSKYAGTTGTYVHSETGVMLDGPFCAADPFLPDFEGLNKYKNIIISRLPESFSFFEMTGVYPTSAYMSVSTNMTTYNTALGGLADGNSAGGWGYRRMHVIDNYLFVTGNSLSTVGGVSRIGLAAYCLEPHDAKPFTTADSTICQLDLQTFTIPVVPFADGYRWEYTGTGADFGNNGTADVGPIDYDLLTANSITIKFLSTATSGQLKVTPYAYCNGTTKMFSNTIVSDITVNPIPNSIAGNDTSINCYQSAVQLYGYSNSPNIVEYLWDYTNNLLDTVGQYEIVTAPGNYVFKVTNSFNCVDFDTVLVTIDTVAPVAIPPSPPYELTCANPVQNFLGTSPTPNTTTEWYQGSTFYPNPISVSASGGYYFRVTNSVNGCIKDTPIFVSLNMDPPNIQIAGYSPLIISQPIDTLTCSENLLSLTCYSDTTNSTVSWINSDTTIFYGDNIDITTAGNYFIYATNNSNGCTNSVGINIASFQNAPNVLIPADNFLNCSVDSLVLNGGSLIAGTSLEWTGSGISPSSNPLTIYDAGVYYLTVTDGLNGCTATDSVVIAQENSINVYAGDDVLTCDKELVNLTANYGGTISGINYLWSNGSTDQNTNYTAGIQPYAVVEVSGDAGCYGTDTVHISTPSVPVINFEGFKPCGNASSGQIVATPVSGLSPFSYSIDNGTNFQSSTVFTGLSVGTYPLIVRDSLNCEYNFSATIDENSLLPTPSFLFSTYNYETDTVIVIDVSNPPTDSTVWVFPFELIVLDNNPISPMILLPDTGAFEIIMQAYYGDCLVEVSKMIYASPFDSLAANQYNLNGIKAVTLYPNPTSGNFTVEVEFYKSQRAALVVQDMLGSTYVFEEYTESLVLTQEIYLDETVIEGTYVMKIISEFDSASITFILAR